MNDGPSPAPGRGRGRGRAPDPQRVAHTRELILRSALTTFLDRGFERTRMVDVATRAGLAKGTLYLHFADKEALFEFVLQQLISAPLAQIRTGIAPPGESLRARLDRLLMPMMRDFEQSGRASVLRLIVAEGARFPALAEIHCRLVIAPMMEIFGEAIRSSATPSQLALLGRFPQLVGAPIVMASVWNGLWAQGDTIDPAAMLAAFFDLVFGPS